ncbi:MAG TPA: type IX secretion system membrane protein PorP/SprF [Chryseolinea sp.]
MKRLLQIAIVMCVAAAPSAAQYIPNSNQAFQFMPVINPAFSGLEGFRDLKLSYRYQWAGYGNNAPKFVNLAYNFRVKEPLDLTLHAIRTSNAPARRKDDIPAMKKATHGLGANLFNERIGPIDRTGGGINYAFHYPVSNAVKISAGVSAQIDNTKIDLDKLYFGSGPDGTELDDPFYDRLVANGSNHTELNVRAGVLVYSEKFYAGLTYYPIVNSSLKTSEVTVGDPFYKGSFQVGAAFPVTPTIEIKPSVLGFWQLTNKFSIDYNVKMYIEQKLWFGVTYRDIQSFVGILGFNLNELLGASYSYEISSNGMQQFNDGSHELVLSVRLNNFKRLSPQTW